MQDKKNKPVEGLLWGEGTICNVKWGGVRLRDLLSEAQVLKEGTLENMHVCFASSVSKCEKDDWYGASIPLGKAMDVRGGALLAYEVRTYRGASCAAANRRIDERPTLTARSWIPDASGDPWLLRNEMGKMGRSYYSVRARVRQLLPAKRLQSLATTCK